MTKVYTLEYRAYEFDDLNYGSSIIKFASLNKNKIIEKFNKEREWNIKVVNEQQAKADEIHKEDYQIYRDEENYFEAWIGKWCYEYSINEYELI